MFIIVFKMCKKHQMQICKIICYTHIHICTLSKDMMQKLIAMVKS